MIKYFLFASLLIFSCVSFAQGFSTDQFPTTWDWRNVNGQNWVTTVRAQNGCGACVAFGLVSTLETQLKIDSNFSWWTPSISIQAMFGCGGGTCGLGWEMTTAIKYIQTHGLVDEACSPYLDSNECKICPDEKNRRYYIQGYSQITQGVADPNILKAALMRGPVWSEMTLYSDFLVYGGWGVYMHHSGPVEGSHTIEMIGWDDTKKAWIVKNSWGTTWGEHGFGYVHYQDTSGLGKVSYTFTFAKNGNYIALENIHDGDIIKQDTPIHAVSENTSVNHLELWIEPNDRSTQKMLSSTDGNSADFTLHPTDLYTGNNNIWIVAKMPGPDGSGQTSFESWRTQVSKPNP